MSRSRFEVTSRMRRFARHACALAAALAASSAFALAAPGLAVAGTYDVEICTQRSQLGEGLTYSESSGTQGLRTVRCGEDTIGNEFGILQFRLGSPVGSVRWTFAAPTNTRVQALRLMRRIATLDDGQNSKLTWSVVGSGPIVSLDLFDDDGSMAPPAGEVTYQVNGSFVSGSLSCLTVCNGVFFEVILTRIVASLEDNFPPRLSGPLSGSLLSAEPLRGPREVTLSAEDLGSGIVRSFLLVDGMQAGTFPDGNGGSCVKPFVHLVPCKLSLQATDQLQTGLFPDGQHLVQVGLEDAAGGRSVSPPFTVTIHNAPTNIAPPLLTGSARLGGELATTGGEWDGDLGGGLAYQWFRCPARTGGGATGSDCAAIAGATQPNYRPSADDVYRRDRVRVTAANSHGSEAAFSAPSEIVPDAQGRAAPPSGDMIAPRLTRVSLSPRRFRVRRPSRGTVLRFSSSEAARLTLAVRPRGAHELARIPTLSRKIRAGRGHLALTGRIGKKLLAPGRYGLTLTAVDAAGNRSKPVRLGFTVLPG
jgi:hypothetical protein